MPTLQHITAKDVLGKLDWPGAIEAIKRGHGKTKPLLSDQFLEQENNTLLSRAAWLGGVGIGVKSVSVMPDNPEQNLPTVQGAMLVFDDLTGAPKAIIDNDVITYWKTAADSALAASFLARPDSQHVLIIGAGVVAESMVRAYQSTFDDLSKFTIVNRTHDKAKELAERLKREGYPCHASTQLEAAASQADIICCATMSTEPVLKGQWVSNGAHVDLIGAFTDSMREADDELLRKASLFVDSYETTIDHIGELKIPLASGVIQRGDVLGDFFQIINRECGRSRDTEITVCKNGGGAHLDLMIADWVISKTKSQG